MRRLMTLPVLLTSLALPIGALAGSAPPPSEVSGRTSIATSVRGHCSARADWHIQVTRDPRADDMTAALQVTSAKPGRRWDYAMVMRRGDDHIRDSAVLTADPSGRWRAFMQWFVNDDGRLTVRAQATSRAGQQCWARFAQTRVPR